MPPDEHPTGDERPPLRLSATTAWCDTRPETIAALAQQFSQQGALVLDDILTPELLALLLRTVAGGGFVADAEHGLGHREVERHDRAGAALRLALGRGRVLQWLEGITGRGPLREVAGTVSRFHAGGPDALGWHDDDISGRRLAISVNLGAPYDGGELEIRDPQGQVSFRHVHRRPGTAVVFDIRSDRQHRLRPVSGGGPRMAFSGWFLGGPPA